MIAVFVNCAAVIVGSILGLIFSKKISSELSDVISTGAGVVTIVLGVQMAFSYQNVIYLTLSLIIGGIIGSTADIDGKILSLGTLIEKGISKNRKGPSVSLASTQTPPVKSNFAFAFLNASVLFCVGAMAILGSFQAGINKEYSIIFTKSVLDGFMAMAFAAAMGLGTAFSAVSILVYQGLLTLLSQFVSPFVSDVMLKELTGVGGALIILIGVNLLQLRKIKTANFLPSILIIIILVLLTPVFDKIASFLHYFV